MDILSEFHENNCIAGILAERYSLDLGHFGIENQLLKHVASGLRRFLCQSPVISFNRIGSDLNIGVDAELTECFHNFINMNFSHHFSSSVFSVRPYACRSGRAMWTWSEGKGN
jgi:hypothetical protein